MFLPSPMSLHLQLSLSLSECIISTLTHTLPLPPAVCRFGVQGYQVLVLNIVLEKGVSLITCMKRGEFSESTRVAPQHGTRPTRGRSNPDWAAAPLPGADRGD